MPKIKKTKQFATQKRIISKNDERLKLLNTKESNKSTKDNQSKRHLTQVSSALFFKHNTALIPPYQVIVDTNFINFAIQNKLELIKGMMDCLLAKCIPTITDCVLAELEKMGEKYRIALRVARDPRFERLPCTHSGTYADDCIVERVRQHKCFIVATCDRDLKRRLRKIDGIPIMYIASHKFQIERLPEFDALTTMQRTEMADRMVGVVRGMDKSRMNRFELMSLYYTLKSVGKVDPSLLIEHPCVATVDEEEEEDIMIKPFSNYDLFFRQFLDLANLLSDDRIDQRSKIVYKQPDKLLHDEQVEDASDLIQQNKLSSILAEKSSRLLRNTRLFSDELKKDRLDGIEMQLESINSRVRSARQGIQAITQKSWWSTISIWGALLVASLVFVWMIIYIRFSSVQREFGDEL